MTNEIREKSFDCVKWTREIRDRHYEETKHMSYDEWRNWLDERLSKNPLVANLKAVAPPSSRWRDHGFHQSGDRAETQIVVLVAHDEASGVYTARALGGAISAQGSTTEEIRAKAKEAVMRYLEATDPLPRPKFICLRFLQDEAIAI